VTGHAPADPSPAADAPTADDPMEAESLVPTLDGEASWSGHRLRRAPPWRHLPRDRVPL